MALRVFASAPLQLVGDGWQQDSQRTDVAHQLETSPRCPAAQQLEHLFEDARRRATWNLGDVLLHRHERLGLDAQAAFRAEPDGAQDPHRVLAHAHVRIADRPDEPRRQIRLPAHVVDDTAFVHVVEEPVDGEVAPPGVLLRAAEHVVVPDEQVLGKVGELVQRALRKVETSMIFPPRKKTCARRKRRPISRELRNVSFTWFG